jgi:hypothetical protein
VQRRQHFRHHDGTLQARVAGLRSPIHHQMSMLCECDNWPLASTELFLWTHNGATETKKQQNWDRFLTLGRRLLTSTIFICLFFYHYNKKSKIMRRKNAN